MVPTTATHLPLYPPPTSWLKTPATEPISAGSSASLAQNPSLLPTLSSPPYREVVRAVKVSTMSFPKEIWWILSSAGLTFKLGMKAEGPEVRREKMNMLNRDRMHSSSIEYNAKLSRERLRKLILKSLIGGGELTHSDWVIHSYAKNVSLCVASWFTKRP